MVVMMPNGQSSGPGFEPRQLHQKTEGLSTSGPSFLFFGEYLRAFRPAVVAGPRPQEAD